jgi:DNA-binding response OmpR family regulator
VVLIANDQEWAGRSLESILTAEGFRVVRAYTGHQALERAADEPIDLAVLDFQMPDLDGVEVCRRLRTMLDATLPIIITTAGAAGRALRVQAHVAGAWAFHGQPLDAELMLGQIHAFLAAKRASDDLRQRTLMDADTGLYNAHGLARRARELCSEARRRSTALAVRRTRPGDIGPNGTKEFGNGTGSADGRGVSAELGRILKRSGRSADAIGRIGPHRYAIMAPQTGPTGAEHLARRIDGLLQAATRAATGHATQLRAGYCAVDDFSKTTYEPEEMLARPPPHSRRDPQRGGSRSRKLAAPTSGRGRLLHL